MRRDAMIKKIEAIVREEALDSVKDALRAIGVVGMNVVEVRGHGRQGGVNAQRGGAAYPTDMIPKIMISIVLSDRNVDKTVEAICAAARSGKEGDGIIVVYPADEIIRVRTGERGDDVLSYQDDIDRRDGDLKR
jgi:nitrogen regulatory protein P-II 1